MINQKLFQYPGGVVGVLIWHVKLHSCMHACMKWVC